MNSILWHWLHVQRSIKWFTSRWNSKRKKWNERKNLQNHEIRAKAELCRIMTQSHLLRHLFELNGTKEHFSFGLRKNKKKWTWLSAKQINSICRKFWNDKIWKSSFGNKLHDVGIEEKQSKRKNWAKMRRFVLFFLEWIYKMNICMHLFNGVTRCSFHSTFHALIL